MNKIYLTVPKKILRRNNTYKLENTEGTTKGEKRNWQYILTYISHSLSPAIGLV
jgi:hypothetical protein